jgi:hypothetical protein
LAVGTPGLSALATEAMMDSENLKRCPARGKPAGKLIENKSARFPFRVQGGACGLDDRRYQARGRSGETVERSRGREQGTSAAEMNPGAPTAAKATRRTRAAAVVLVVIPAPLRGACAALAVHEARRELATMRSPKGRLSSDCTATPRALCQRHPGGVDLLAGRGK